MSDRSTDEEQRRPMTHDDNDDDEDGGERSSVDGSPVGASAQGSADGMPRGASVDRGGNDDYDAAEEEEEEDEEEERMEALPPFVLEDTELPVAAADVPDANYHAAASEADESDATTPNNFKGRQCQSGAEGHHDGATAASQCQPNQQPLHGTPSSEAEDASGPCERAAMARSDGINDDDNATSAEQDETKGSSAVCPAARPQPPRGPSGNGSHDAKWVGATTTAEEEAPTSSPERGSYQQQQPSLPSAVSVPGHPNDERRDEAGISDEHAENDDHSKNPSTNRVAARGTAFLVPNSVAPDRPSSMPPAQDHHHAIEGHVAAPSEEDRVRAEEEQRERSMDRRIRELQVGAFSVPIPVAAPAAMSAVRRSTTSSSEQLEEEDEIPRLADATETLHEVVDAHVAPSSWHDRVRDHLVRNAPVVEATAVVPDDDDNDEERLVESGGAAATARRARGVHEEAPVTTTAKHPRYRAFVVFGLLLVALVVAVAVPLAVALTSRKNNDDDHVAATPGDDDGALTTATSIPSSSPSSANPHSSSDRPSARPTGAPTTERFASVQAVLIDAGVPWDDDESFIGRDTSSPRYRSVRWLAEDDVANGLSLVNDTAADRWVQRYALATLYFATGGNESSSPSSSSSTWTQECSFLSPEHECKWNDRVVSSLGGMENRSIGVFCDASDRVVSIDLRGNNLIGSLPNDISLLSRLEKIHLAQNELAGSIPQGIGTLDKLEFLDLSINRFSGTIPSTMWDLSHLKILWLTSNAITGTLSPSVGNLVNLTCLALGTNWLTGTLPESIGELANLQLFGIATGNMFTGVIPESINRLDKLVLLHLSGNRLNGSLPLLPGALPSLQLLSAWGNILSGSIPSSVGTLSSLEVLSLSNNRLTSEIPGSIGNISTLKAIGMVNNNLNGTIPSAIGNAGRLERLVLGDNNLVGTIPPDLISNNPRLHIVSMGTNNLNGTIPSVLGGLESLWMLDLHSNKLGGTIPDALGNNTNLRYLDLGNNALVGTVPNSFQKLEKLDWLTVSRNSLTGELTFLCRNDTAQLYADCADPVPEVKCPCCTMCCRDGVGSCDDTYLQPFTIIQILCWQTLVDNLRDRSEHFLDLICTDDILFEQLAQNENTV